MNKQDDRNIRFAMVLDSLDALVYVADMETHEVLFLNEYGRKIFGDVTGMPCWQTLQAGQTGPCSFCTNAHLLDDEGRPTGVHHWEFQNTVTGRWFDIRDRAILWPDGRYVRLEIATDITKRKELEEERHRLIDELQDSLARIKTLSGLLPICAWCHKVRDDAGYWQQVEDYIEAHSDASFTHGICPDCLRRVQEEEEKAEGEEENPKGKAEK